MPQTLIPNLDTQTPVLELPYIVAGQAQKHITHNEALARLDQIIHISVESRTVANPPDIDTIEAGTRYVIANGATGEWGEHSGKMAVRASSTGWDFITLGTGWIIWVKDEAAAFIFDGTGLKPLASETSAAVGAPEFGVNTTADATNRLSVKSDAVLLSHDDVTPGSGDMRMVINKSSPGSTASLLYQSDYTGHAEMGLTGGKDFTVKVSANGSDWEDALHVDAVTGAVAMPQTPARSAALNLLGDAGRFAGNAAAKNYQVGAYVPPAYLSPYNGASFEAGPKFIQNSTTYGGSGAALDPIVQSLMERLRAPNLRRYGIEFYLMKATAGAGQNAALNAHSGTHYLSLTNASVPIPAQLTLNFHIIVESGSVAIARNGTLIVEGSALDDTDHTITPATGWQQITHHVDYPQNGFSGYQSNLFRLFATPGSVYYIAAPYITPGHVPHAPGQFYSIVPNAEAWR